MKFSKNFHPGVDFSGESENGVLFAVRDIKSHEITSPKMEKRSQNFDLCINHILWSEFCGESKNGVLFAMRVLKSHEIRSPNGKKIPPFRFVYEPCIVVRILWGIQKWGSFCRAGTQIPRNYIPKWKKSPKFDFRITIYYGQNYAGNAEMGCFWPCGSLKPSLVSEAFPNVSCWSKPCTYIHTLLSVYSFRET